MRRVARAALLSVALLPAHETISTKITWTQEISRIFYRRCLDCHGPQSSVPLTTYAEVRPWATAIREEVSERRMPPWDAVRGFGDFHNDASLTPAEMERIVQWVEGGAPKGSEVYLENLPLDTPPLPEPKSSGGFVVNGDYAVKKPVTLYGLEPRVADGASLQVIACEKDGTEHPLLWIPAYRKQWHRTYWLREPVVLPAGSEIRAWGGKVFVATGRTE